MLLYWEHISDHHSLGGVAERLIAPVLKTGRPKGLVSSNLTPSANLRFGRRRKREAATPEQNEGGFGLIFLLVLAVINAARTPCPRWIADTNGDRVRR
jgi:hypothetical protein